MVRAVRGERSTYAPIRSPLCASSDPSRVARRLCEHVAASVLYLADLDALTGGPVQDRILARLLADLPGLALWLDAGFADADAFRRLAERLGADAARVTPVFASECLATPQAARAALADPAAAILSLDRRGGAALDRAGCWDDTTLWPQRVILMTLERVGGLQGPDLDTLRAQAARAPAGTLLIGAGGIRDAHDLARARDAGAHAWLVASALHDLRIDPRR